MRSEVRLRDGGMSDGSGGCGSVGWGACDDGVLGSLAVAAHELKAPLVVMRQLAFAIGEAESLGECRELAEEIRASSEQALRQANDLTKVARLEDGLFELEPVGVRALCAEVAEELRPFFKSERRSLVLDFHNKSPIVTANRELLRSIIYNFCTNAARYSDAESRSRLRLQDCRGSVRISVRDFGPALPVKLWRQLRAGRLEAPAPIAMRPGSSGLGLYIASVFSAYMNARLGAIRHRDGTSFYVELPISQQARLL